MTLTERSSQARAARAPLVRRMLSREDRNVFELVEWSERSAQISERDGSVAFACESVEAPISWSNLAVAVVVRRYFAREPSAPPERSIRALVERVVGAIAGWARDAGHGSGAAERDALQDELAAMVLAQRATFATPVWLNAGLTDRPLISACFILKAEDSIPELLQWNTREGLIFQQGGGAGINLSGIRSSREPVSRGGLASGPVSFMRTTDAWAATIRAGGRARRGAARKWSCSTPRIRTFFSSSRRRRGRRIAAECCLTADIRRRRWRSRCRSSTPTTRCVSDEFMRLAIDGGEWALRAVRTGEVLETFPACRLLCACAEAAARCGDPGLQFADQIARWHTCPNTGPITASNPCGEFLHVADSACNLATLNILAFVKDREFDIDGFTAAIELLVLAQDAIVDGSGYPSQEIERNAHRLRQIGIGHPPGRAAALARDSL